MHAFFIGILSLSLSLLPFPSLSHSDKLLSQDRGLQQKNVTQQNADCQYNWVTSLSDVKKMACQLWNIEALPKAQQIQGIEYFDFN